MGFGGNKFGTFQIDLSQSPIKPADLTVTFDSTGWSCIKSLPLSPRIWNISDVNSTTTVLLIQSTEMSTTLITFRLQVHSSVRSVEILGSWDNFSQPYPLKRDRRTGSGDWRGCHTFNNISCDGDLEMAPVRRDGGLMMGGTYWYYYRLDDELEYHDPAEPSTTSCPFLPGQSVNVLDVPMQFSSGEDHFRKEPTSSTGSTVYTMDPQAKYVSPVPSVRRKAKVPFLETSEISVPSVTKPSPLLTVRSLHAMSSTAPNSESLLESAPAEPFPKYTSTSLPAPEHIPVVTAFQRLRGTKSADRIELLGLKHRNQSLLKSKVRNVLTESLSGLGRSNGHTSGSGAKPVISNKSPLRHTVRTQSVEDGTRVGAHSANNIGLVISGMKAQVRSASGVFSPVEIFSTKGSGDNSGVSEHELPAVPDSPYYTPLEQLRENKSFFEENATNRWNSCLSAIAMDCPDPVSDDQCSIHPVFRHAPDLLDVRPLPTHRTSLELRNNSFLPSETSFLDDNSDYEACNQEKSIASSEDIHEIFSPYLAASTVQTDTMSPYRLSQSISPLRSDFGEALLDLRDEQNLETSLKNTHEGFEKFRLPPLFEEFSRSQQTSYRSSSGFEGYSLPEEEQSSVLTLRNLPSSRLDDPSRDLPFSRQGSKDLVRSWNDGSEHRINGSQHRNNMTALDELVEDLGYLGEMIV